MTPFNNVYITQTASFLPGDAVDNEEMDSYIGPINKTSGRMKTLILAENGIQKRHYAIDKNGKSLHSVTSMGAKVVEQLLDNDTRVEFLSAATTGADSAAPGLANLIQGEMHLPPLETLSVSGICAASIGALNAAALAVESSAKNKAIALASEFPSRLFKASRFQNRTADIDFDAHFLRWMLSDGAGGAFLANHPSSDGVSLKIKWIHQKSFSGDMPTCMQVGMSVGNQLPGYLDYPTLAEAEKAGAFDLRQNIRILPNLFDLGLHEYAQLVKEGHVDPKKISHFLCHYSSERFKPMIAKLMEEAGIAIAPEKWFSNLTSKGNTGSASIYIMLDEFFKTNSASLNAGDQIFGFVPESGRFSVAYFLLEVVNTSYQPAVAKVASPVIQQVDLPPAPISAEGETGDVAYMLQSLMGVWHDYRSEVFRTEIAQAVMQGKLSVADYLTWMECWIPQVREGSLWMRRAVSSMNAEYKDLAKLVQLHAGEEQLDWQVLYQDYQNAGGILNADHLKRNPGGEALNAYMHAYAARPNPVGLLGGIYIIEGTGHRIIPTLLPRIKESLKVNSSILKFIEYHGENDQAHMARWLNAVKMVALIEPKAMHEIVRVAETVAALYLQQWKYIR
ncbi:MAG TPA: iron-containing redox enzyme family protein [Methylotenera sp.]|nr:iron-containing redox enzyme family protein [Methylotenera sp.]HPH04619.1 iron-containing redox enzyme family protein [Methylotenera sp.]HPN01608.1 iron-containing redox enzyme family protein [Methylotenera sp.]